MNDIQKYTNEQCKAQIVDFLEPISMFYAFEVYEGFMSAQLALRLVLRQPDILLTPRGIEMAEKYLACAEYCEI